MLPFLYAGVVSVVGVVLGKRLAAAQASRPGGQVARRSTLTVQVLAHRLLEETRQTLATEEVPMDNRFGNKPLSSEHEFSQTATVSLELGDSRRVTTATKTTLWGLLENKAELAVGKGLGIEVGSQITRRVRLRFATDPGQFVRYRVVWQQMSQRGVLEMRAGRQIVQLPYLVVYGLSHTVESLPGESLDQPPQADDAPTGKGKKEPV
ncbi:MAG: hypothetical protein HQL87_11000 [Magnetococcales bacterium]|nr:hypothetical protein [Magnetococcales bacterium]